MGSKVGGTIWASSGATTQQHKQGGYRKWRLHHATQHDDGWRGWQVAAAASAIINMQGLALPQGELLPEADCFYKGRATPTRNVGRCWASMPT